MTNANTSPFKKLKAKILALITAALFMIGVIAIISNIMLSSQIEKYQRLIAVENNAVAQIGALNLQFKTHLEGVAQGDFDAPVVANREDEIAEMSAAIQVLSNKLRDE
jgi:hypothetical protein